MTTPTVGAVPWYQSPVMISQIVTAISAGAAFAPKLAAQLGLSSTAEINSTVTTIFGGISVLSALYGGIKRYYAALQPLTLTAAGAAAHPATMAVTASSATTLSPSVTAAFSKAAQAPKP